MPGHRHSRGATNQRHRLKTGLVHDLVVAFQRHLIAQIGRHQRGRARHVAEHGRLHRKVSGHSAQTQGTRRNLRSAHSQRYRRGDTHNQALVQGNTSHQHRPAVLAHLQGVHRLGIFLNLLGGAAQRLNHADAAHRLLNTGGQIARHLLNLMRGAVVLAGEVHQRQHQNRHRHHEHQRQGRRRTQHEEATDQEHHHNSQHLNNTEGQPTANRPQIAHGAGQQLTGGPTIQQRKRGAEQAVKEVHAHGQLNCGGRVHNQPAPPIHEGGVRNTQQKHQAAGNPNGALGGALREMIHNNLQHLRNSNLKGTGTERYQQAKPPPCTNRTRIRGECARGTLIVRVVDRVGGRFARGLQEGVAAPLSRVCCRCFRH